MMVVDDANTSLDVCLYNPSASMCCGMSDEFRYMREMFTLVNFVSTSDTNSNHHPCFHQELKHKNFANLNLLKSLSRYV